MASPAEKPQFLDEGVNATLRQQIAARLVEACEGYSYRKIGRLTGTNHETARRYILGMTAPPPEFIAICCIETKVSPEWLLLGKGPKRGWRGKWSLRY